MKRRDFLKRIPRVAAAIGLTPILLKTVPGAWSDLRRETSTTSSSTATTHTTQSHPIVINMVCDSKEMERYIRSARGRVSMLNVIGKNSNQIRGLLK